MPDPTTKMLDYFEYEHLTHERLRDISKKFHKLAHEMAAILPAAAETTVALRKLLESKDAAVRSALDLPEDASAHTSFFMPREPLRQALQDGDVWYPVTEDEVVQPAKIWNAAKQDWDPAPIVSGS